MIVPTSAISSATSSSDRSSGRRSNRMPDVVAHEFDCVDREALQSSLRSRRGDHGALTHAHDARAGSLRDPARLVEQHGVVVAVPTRLDSGDPSDLVVGCALDARGHGYVRWAPPTAHADAIWRCKLLGLRERRDHELRTRSLAPVTLGDVHRGAEPDVPVARREVPGELVDPRDVLVEREVHRNVEQRAVRSSRA